MGIRNILRASTVSLLVLGWAALNPAPALAASPPAAPVITEPAVNGQLVSGADVHMETAPMQDADGDAHRCTDWAIWTVSSPVERAWSASCVGGVLKVHIHLGDGVFENSHAGRSSLFPQRDYELRVRHRDDSGDPTTEWSPYSVRRFRTDVERTPPPGAPEWTVMQAGYVVEKVATGFQLPVNIAPLRSYAGDPSKPMLYVAELYGTIKTIRGNFTSSVYAANLLNFNPTGQFPGSGEKGLTGIAVDPITGDIFASMVYESGGEHFPKVVRLHSTDGGVTASVRTTILDMPGEPQGASHQISNLTIGPDGKLYIHVGDGFDSQRARNLESFQGKILRANLDGTAPSNNPFYNLSNGLTARDYVYAYGFRNPFGGAWRASDGFHYEVENGPSIDRFARVIRGRDYLWDGTNDSIRAYAQYVWEPAHAPVNVDFIEPGRFHASGFPEEKYGNAFVSESGPTYATGPQARGKRIVELGFRSDGSVTSPRTLVEYSGSGKSTVAGLASGPNGLYFTNLYPDNPAAGPTGAQAALYRVRYDPLHAGPPATVYQHRDFAGNAQSLSSGIHEALLGQLSGVGNDQISSLRVSAGYRVVVCAHDHAGRTNTGNLGLCRFYGPGNHAFVGTDLNDAISLIAVLRAGSGDVMKAFEHRTFGGRTSSFGIGIYEAIAGELGAVGNDTISSLKLTSNHRLVVCANDSYGRTNTGNLGLCRFYAPGDHSFVGADLNDTISLIAVAT